MSKGRCKKGETCTFAHGRKELRQAPKEEAPLRVQVEKALSEPMKINVGHSGLMSPELRAFSQLEDLNPTSLARAAFRPPPGLLAANSGYAEHHFENYFGDPELQSSASTSSPYSPRLEIYASEPCSPKSITSEVFHLWEQLIKGPLWIQDPKGSPMIFVEQDHFFCVGQRSDVGFLSNRSTWCCLKRNWLNRSSF